jgi:hypothetical protein
VTSDARAPTRTTTTTTTTMTTTRASVVDDGASRETRIHRTMMMMDEGAGKP